MIRNEQWEDFKSTFGINDEEFKTIRDLVDGFKSMVIPEGRLQVEVAMLKMDNILFELEKIIQTLSLLHNFQEKVVQSKYYELYEELKNTFRSIAELERDINSNSQYREETQKLKKMSTWIQFFKELYWIFRSRVENLREIHRTSI